MKLFFAFTSVVLCALTLGQVTNAVSDHTTGKHSLHKGKRTLTDIKYAHFEKAGSPSGNKNSTIGATGSGFIAPFGQYGGDCSINWHDGISFGGGFNSGIKDAKKKQIMGLGGGFNYNASLINVGAGISAFGNTVNYQLSIKKEGAIVITFDSTKPLKCVPTTTDSQKPTTISCTAV